MSARIIAWSVWRRSHQAAARQAHLNAKCNCNAKEDCAVSPASLLICLVGGITPRAARNEACLGPNRTCNSDLWCRVSPYPTVLRIDSENYLSNKRSGCPGLSAIERHKRPRPHPVRRCYTVRNRGSFTRSHAACDLCCGSRPACLSGPLSPLPAFQDAAPLSYFSMA